MKVFQSLSMVLALAVCAQAQSVRVGVQLPLTGERSDVGALMKNVLQMSADKVNASSKGQKWELVWADDESTTEGATKALDKLLQDPRVIAIVGEINSPLVMASAPLVDKAGVPYITGGSSPRTTAASPWIFRAGASDALLTGFMAQYVVDELKMKSIAILHDKTGIHNQRAGMLADALKSKYGLDPAVNETWSPGDKDFSAQLAKVKASGAQAIVALGETPEGGPFFKSVKASGLKVQVIAHRDFGVKPVFDEAGSAVDGALIVTEFAPALMPKATQDWVAAYAKQFGSAPNVIAAQYYDSLLLLAEAAKSGANRAGVKAGLEKIRAFPGVMADYTFDAGRNGVHRFFVARAANGKLVLVKTLAE